MAMLSLSRSARSGFSETLNSSPEKTAALAQAGGGIQWFHIHNIASATAGTNATYLAVHLVPPKVSRVTSG